jgi:hypothetical protein
MTDEQNALGISVFSCRDCAHIFFIFKVMVRIYVSDLIQKCILIFMLTMFTHVRNCLLMKKAHGTNRIVELNKYIDGFYTKTTQKGGFSKLCVKIKKRCDTDLLHFSTWVGLIIFFSKKTRHEVHYFSL